MDIFFNTANVSICFYFSDNILTFFEGLRFHCYLRGSRSSYKSVTDPILSKACALSSFKECQKNLLGTANSMRINLNGNWIGFYQYDNGYPESLRNRKTLFEAILGQGSTEFIGKVREQNEGGEMEEIRVKGTLIDNRIIFTKHITKSYLLNESGELNPVPIEKDTTLYYRGLYHTAEGKFKGNWENPEGGIYNPGGTWEMWRKETSY